MESDPLKVSSLATMESLEVVIAVVIDGNLFVKPVGLAVVGK